MDYKFHVEIEPIDAEQARAEFLQALQLKLQAEQEVEQLSGKAKRGKFGRIKPPKPPRVRSKRSRRTQTRPPNKK